MAFPQTKAPSQGIVASATIEDSVPLYKRAPRADENGRPLADFMMIIPRLRTLPPRLIQKKIERIQRVLTDFNHVVVFADLNLKINVLSVSVRQSPGACVEIPLAIISVIPEALLVAHPRFC